MLIAWGSFATHHPRRTAELERCASCGQDAATRRAIERTGHFMAMPLVPLAFRSTTQCAHCKHVTIDPAMPGARPKRAMAWRVAVAWGFVIAAIAAGVLGSIATHRQTSARALEPAVGDEWTIRTSRWPGLPDGMLAYARAKIDTIEHGVITADACEYTSDDDDTIEKKCRQYTIELAPIDVSLVPSLVERGAITSIWRGGDPMAAYFAVIGMCIAGGLINGLFAWRAARRSRRADDPVPRAEIA
jgi:hypothetical protein